MAAKIFVNLPVKDLPNSMEFFKKLGHGLTDLDGHIWELAYMEPSAIQK